MQKVNLAQKLTKIGEYWRPKVVGELNGQEEPAATRNTGNIEHDTLTAPVGDRL